MVNELNKVEKEVASGKMGSFCGMISPIVRFGRCLENDQLILNDFPAPELQIFSRDAQYQEGYYNQPPNPSGRDIKEIATKGLRLPDAWSGLALGLRALFSEGSDQGGLQPSYVGRWWSARRLQHLQVPHPSAVCS